MANRYSAEDLRTVESLLEGLSSREVWEHCIHALRRWRVKHRDEITFNMHGGLGVELVTSLSAAKDRQVDSGKLKEVILYGQRERALQDVVEFTWWMVRSGLAIPFSADPGRVDQRGIWDEGTLGYPTAFRLTRSGMALLDIADEHPLLPGWSDRVRQRCPGIPEEVVALLEDARACMDVSLLRPAIVLMGVAYEAAINAVIEELKVKAYLSASIDKEQKAAARLAKTAAVIDVILTDADDRRTARAAYDFAELLRRRRNDGAHTRPRYGFEDRQEVEGFIVFAAWHLPGLWSLTRDSGSAAASVPPGAPVVTK